MKTEFAGLFPLQRVMVTPGAQEALSTGELIGSLSRHIGGDWGDVSEEDQLANDVALKIGRRLFSSYRTDAGTKFWIISEHDRSVTTVLLPQEY